MAHYSISEEHGLASIPEGSTAILSVGISTEGAAECRMAKSNPDCRVIATTLDTEGSELAKRHIKNEGLEDRVSVKIEDVSQPAPYPTNTFDYIYARLVLHYLDKHQLAATLQELHRVLKPSRSLYVVVRSRECPAYHRPTSTHDEATGLTTYITSKGEYVRKRYFHTKESIRGAIEEARFTVKDIKQYDERLSLDFDRSVLLDYDDNVIEVLATKQPQDKTELRYY